MRILVTNVFYRPQSIGGATRVVEDNVGAFASDPRVAATGVFCSVNGSRDPRYVRNYRVGTTQVQAVATKLIANADFLVSDELIRKRFSAYLDYFCPDIIHFHCIQRLTSDIVIEAKERKIPYLITMHDGWWISDYQFLIDQLGEIQTYDYTDADRTREIFGADGFQRQEALRPALDGAEYVLTVSDTFREIINNAGLPNVDVIPNGVSKIDILEKQRSEKISIGYLAGVSHAKGYHVLRTELMHGHFKNLKLVIVDHSIKQDESITEFWGSTEVQRIGFVPQSQIAKLYQKLNVVIVPSLWPESFGLVAREALLTRTWLLASLRGAASEDVLEGQNGHTFDPVRKGDLTRVLKLVDATPDKYRTAPVLTKLTTSDDQANALLELYSQILS